MSEKDKLAWIYSSRNTEDLAQRYDVWADDYDQDLEEGYGWQIPEIMARELTQYAPAAARILDAGAGTGLVGMYLSSHGYRDLVAMDLSREMLARAREKGVYREFHQMDMSENLDFPDDAFDALVCAGVLTYSHAPAKSLYEMVRVTKPGGHILFSLRTDAYASMGFDAIVRDLESNGRWKLIDKKGHQSFTEMEQDVIHDIWVYEVA